MSIDDYFDHHEPNERWCNDCEKVVNVRTITEFQGEREHGGYIHYDECSECGGNDFSDIGICGNCEESTKFGDNFCEECKERARVYISHILFDACCSFEEELVKRTLERWLEDN